MWVIISSRYYLNTFLIWCRMAGFYASSFWRAKYPLFTQSQELVRLLLDSGTANAEERLRGRQLRLILCQNGRLREETSWGHWGKWFHWPWVFSRLWVNSLPNLILISTVHCSCYEKKKNQYLILKWSKLIAVNLMLVPFSYLPLPLSLSVFAPSWSFLYFLKRIFYPTLPWMVIVCNYI